MLVLGLTGGIGMGKSTAAELLAQRGLPVIDTDALAHQLVEPGQPALAEIEQHFGEAVIDLAGRLRRDEVARRVFANESDRLALENILHPRIRERWKAQVAQWRNEGRSQCVIVIPLLFETKAEAEFDAIICVACSNATQKRRLAARGWTEEQIQQRIQAQWPVQKKMLASHYVVWTEGDLEVHAQQLDRILSSLRPDPVL